MVCCCTWDASPLAGSLAQKDRHVSSIANLQNKQNDVINFSVDFKTSFVNYFCSRESQIDRDVRCLPLTNAGEIPGVGICQV